MASPDNEIRLDNESDDIGDKIFHLNNAVFILEGEGHRAYADEIRAESNALLLSTLEDVVPLDES